MKKENPIAKLPPFTVTRVASTLSQSMGWQITNTRVPNTWNITKGENIRICIIDTGCPITKKNGMFHLHPDLVGSVDVDNSKSFVPDEGIEDLNGHSTHCCGIIAAQNNSIGMVGVAPKATIITYKALNKDGMGGMNQISDALECALKNKFDIISMSLGCPIGDDRMHDLVKKLFTLNVVLVGAAGNDGVDAPVNYPAAYPEYIAVGAYDKTDSLADFSCTGPELTIAAPGVDIYSTYLNDSYAVLSGTSMATPFMAGTIALLKSKHQKQLELTGEDDCVTVDQVKEHIKKYATDKGIIGRDTYWGYGIIDVDKLINAQETGPIVLTPEGDTYDSEDGVGKSWFQKMKDWFWKSFVRPFPPKEDIIDE
jgi:subtilisin family serine protease